MKLTPVFGNSAVQTALLLCLVAAPVWAQDFGSAPANGAPISQTISVAVPNPPSGVLPVAMQYGVDFSVSSSGSCSSSSCSLQITFSPKYPGLRQDAILVKDASGNVLARQFVHGVGTAPLAAFYPAVISTILSGTDQIPLSSAPRAGTTSLQKATGVVVDPLGNVFVADSRANAIFKIDYSSGNPSFYASVPGANALAIDAGGTLYVSTGTVGRQVVKIDPETLAVSVVAGTGASGGAGDNGPATLATLDNPIGVAVDTAGNLFIADAGSLVIRRVDAQSGIITTYAGEGLAQPAGPGVPANSATFSSIGGVAVDGAGNVYVSDTLLSTIYVIEQNTGFIWTLAGENGSAPPGQALILYEGGPPKGLAVDSAGNVFVTGNGVTGLLISQGKSLSVAGGGSPAYGSVGDGGPATSAVLSGYGIALDSSANIYVADNDRVRKITISTGVLSFRQVAVGATGPSQSIEVENAGNATLSVEGIAASTGFSLPALAPGDCTSATLLAPSVACPISVAFSPVSPQRTTGALTITTNSNNQASSQTQANLVGGPAIVISPSAVTFPSQSVGITSAPLEVTFTNTAANQPLLPAVSITGLNASDFTESNNCVGNLAPGNSCTMSIFFTPQTSGARSASLLVNDPYDPIAQSIPLTGVGGATSGCVVTAFQATPNPVISATTAGETTVSAAATCNFDLRSGSSSGGIVLSGSPGATASIATGVSDGDIFYLQPSGDTSASDTLGILIIHLQATGTSTEDFPGVPVNTTSTPANLTLQFSGLGAPPSFALRLGFEFSLGAAVCTSAETFNCQVPVTFRPLSPGLRQDAILVHDAAGTLITTAFVSGIGLGPQWAVTPGTISTIASGAGEPLGLALDPTGNVYFSASTESISQIASNGVVTPIAGHLLQGLGGYGGDGGPAVNALLNGVAGLALDGAGNLLIADSANNAIRRVDSQTGIITTVVGHHAPYFAGDGGPAQQASLNSPLGVAIDRNGNLFIADTGNSAVRRVDALTGIVRTVAGNGTAGYSGDNGPATQAQLQFPSAVAIDSTGNLFIADGLEAWGAGYVRRVDANTNIITTIAGAPTNNALPVDGALATSAYFGFIRGLAVDAGGNLYISDLGTNLIRRVDTLGVIRTVAGTAGQSYAGDGGPATSAYLNGPSGLAVDTAGNLYFADNANYAIRKVSAAGSPLSFLASLSDPAPSQTISLSNIGNQPLSLGGVKLLSEIGRAFQPANDASDFTETTNCQSSLTAGTDCQAIADFAPAAGSGTRTAKLEFAIPQQTRRQNVSPAVPLSGYITPSIPCVVTAFFLTEESSATVVTVNANCDYDLRVGGPGGTLLAQSHDQATFSLGANAVTITDGLEFYLQTHGDTSPQGTLAVVIATAGEGVCPITTFSATPSLSVANDITISVNAGCSYDVRQGSPNGTLIGQGSLQTNLTAVPAPNDTVFYLQRTGNTTSGGTLAVATYSNTVACMATRFSASPSPIHSSSPVGVTTITVYATCNWDIRVGSPSGSLFASGLTGSLSSVPTGNWVENATTFYLQQSGTTTPAGTIGKLTVGLVQQ